MKHISRQQLRDAIEEHDENDPMDLSGHDLAGADFSGQELVGAIFSGARLSDADFSGANLEAAKFSGANLVRADFSGANLSHADLSWADMTGANTSETSMHGADMSGTILAGKAPHRSGRSGIDADLVGFPKQWSYFPTAGNGTPLMTSPGVFDASYIAALAKFQLVTLNITPFADTNANTAVVSRLKTINSRLKILWYSYTQWAFQNLSPGTMWGDSWSLIINGPDKRVHCADATQYPNPPNAPLDEAWWNWMNGSSAATFANIWRQYGKSKADGYFFDTFVARAFKNPVPPDPHAADFALYGYASLNAMNDASEAAADTFVRTALAADDANTSWCNRGGDPTTTPDYIAHRMTGELIEGWDRDWGLGGGTPPGFAFADFDAAMNLCLTWQPSDFTKDNSILIATLQGVGQGGPAVHTVAWNRNMRYTQASATVAGGYACTSAREGASDAFNLTDEWFVDAAGVTDQVGLPQNQGWLGRPTSAATRDSSGIWWRKFQKGMVVVTPNSGGPYSMNLDRPYKKIVGAWAPSVNDGSTITAITNLQFKDGLFLRAT